LFAVLLYVFIHQKNMIATEQICKI